MLEKSIKMIDSPYIAHLLLMPETLSVFIRTFENRWEKYENSYKYICDVGHKMAVAAAAAKKTPVFVKIIVFIV
jgi:hypothetical protein